ncbi:hypothetical protein HORIV_72650 [Vreelandella olivaria]|uniref:Uncharacterized protein n=1 Tax=Vreelandella olivaria TaxID=390919 RepID=A0ABM7GTB2_9GAMM|nr:hypothetical protein HORIV_72650 [Halomonas olivaria]
MNQAELNKEELCRFICQELPSHRLQQMLESIEAAFQKSDSHLKETYRHVPWQARAAVTSFHRAGSPAKPAKR